MPNTPEDGNSHESLGVIAVMQRQLSEDMRDLKAVVTEIGHAITKIAVQDEKIVNLKNVSDEQDKKISNITLVQTTCSIKQVQSDVTWLKWFVMLIIALLLGITISVSWQGANRPVEQKVTQHG